MIVRREHGALHAVGRPALAWRSGLRQWWHEGRLHRADGPAVETPAGTRLWYWRGTLIPRSVWDREEWTPRDLFSVLNVEVRRCVLERRGYEWLEACAEILDRNEVKERTLYRVWGDPEPLVWVRVRCPSTGREYRLRVPPDQQYADAAVAWTFAVTADAYARVIES